MSLPDLPRQAEGHLRAIRSLMERATIYRAISAPTALIGGVASLFATWLCLQQTRPGSLLDPYDFLALWLAVLVGMVVLNTSYIWSAAKSRSEPFFSPGLRMAIGAVTPPFLSTAAFTVWLAWEPEALLFAILWCTGYGLGLLATASFAPRSLLVLGAGFLLTGLTLPFGFFATDNPIDRNTLGVLAMGVSFGLYHILYAVAVYATHRRRPNAP